MCSCWPTTHIWIRPRTQRARQTWHAACSRAGKSARTGECWVRNPSLPTIAGSCAHQRRSCQRNCEPQGWSRPRPLTSGRELSRRLLGRNPRAINQLKAWRSRQLAGDGSPEYKSLAAPISAPAESFAWSCRVPSDWEAQRRSLEAADGRRIRSESPWWCRRAVSWSKQQRVSRFEHDATSMIRPASVAPST